MMHFIISGNIRKEIRNIMSFTELKKLHWLLSNGHFSVISERALVFSAGTKIYIKDQTYKSHFPYLTVKFISPWVKSIIVPSPKQSLYMATKPSRSR